MFDILALQRAYPDHFFRLMPFANSIVNRYGRNRVLTESDINRMVAELIIISNITGAPLGHGSSIMDLARMLILINLYNSGYVIDPFWLLYFGSDNRFLLRPFMHNRPGFPRPLVPIRPPMRPVHPGPMPIRPPMRPVHPGPIPMPRPPIAPPRPGLPPNRPPMMGRPGPMGNRPRPSWR